MHLLVIAATGPEMTSIKSQIKNLQISGLDVHFFTTWIGNYETIFSLTKYLESNPKNIPDFLLNIWVCGYTDNKPEFIQVARIINASIQKEIMVPLPIIVWILATCVSSETPVITWNESYYDMEAFAVEYVGQKYKIPRIILKIPVDRIGWETNNFDYKKALTMVEQQIPYREVLENIKGYITPLTPLY